jgi:hypothetical protein
MEALAAAVILLTAISYLIVRIVIFVTAVRRKERSASPEKDKESQ